MCARTTKVGSPISASSQNSLVGTEPVKSTIFQVQCDDSNALAFVHDKIQSEVLDKEVGVVSERLAVKGVQDGVAGAIGGGSATVCLTTLPKLQRLTTECALVDLSIFRSGERYPIAFKLIQIGSLRVINAIIW